MLDALRTAALAVAYGIHPASHGPGNAVRRLLHAVPQFLRGPWPQRGRSPLVHVLVTSRRADALLVSDHHLVGARAPRTLQRVLTQLQAESRSSPARLLLAHCEWSP